MGTAARKKLRSVHTHKQLSNLVFIVANLIIFVVYGHYVFVILVLVIRLVSQLLQWIQVPRIH